MSNPNVHKLRVGTLLSRRDEAPAGGKRPSVRGEMGFVGGAQRRHCLGTPPFADAQAPLTDSAGRLPSLGQNRDDLGPRLRITDCEDRNRPTTV